LKTTIFPEPAAHGLMYSTSTVRILAGMIESFLSDHIDERLGAAWQLHTLTTAGKWDVKNLKKWQAVDACSEPIGGIFRAMKTMREVDDVHSPQEFVKHWSSAVIPDGVAVVMDISHETPVYRPAGLEDGGVEYMKFPTVSKEKPKAEEVEQFIALVDKLRKSSKFEPTGNGTARPTIGVHCHYGFNRTGFFIVCYLVEREGYRLQDAIEEFKTKRPPGIKHDHFVNELYVWYAVKMERRATLQVE
jgi:protein-tyrosine phosphatase